MTNNSNFNAKSTNICKCSAWQPANCTCGADWNNPKVLQKKLETANQIIKDLQAHMYYNEARARFDSESG
jgi:hypothetical protein